MHLDMRFWGSKTRRVFRSFCHLRPGSLSILTRFPSGETRSSFYLRFYLCCQKSHSPTNSISTPPSPPFSRRAGPSYHLSRPAHVSVVREVPGIHTFAVQHSCASISIGGVSAAPLRACLWRRYSTPRHGSPVVLCHSHALAWFQNLAMLVQKLLVPVRQFSRRWLSFRR